LKRVPVIDIQGVALPSCPVPYARRLLRKGQAIACHDEQGVFYIQLTGPDQRTRRRAKRVAQRGLSWRARQAAQQQALWDAVIRAPFEQEHSMEKRLDQLIVIDIESTCWNSHPPDGQQQEIIEIGICMLEVASGERLERRSLLVRPEYSEVSPFCTELTTLTQEQVAEGVPFDEACAILRSEYGAAERVWASYGDYDRRQFEKQCTQRGIAYPFGPSHINVKNLLALVYGLPREVGMVQALALMDLPVEGTHHRGVDDAWNTGLLLARLLLQRRGELTH
jgi:inhibitor of KinA sporulation pathway (predicted exonuclease)